MKIKVKISDKLLGVSYNVYKKGKFWGWNWCYGYKTINSYFFLFDDDIYRLKKQYGNDVTIENNSKIYTYEVPKYPKI